MKGSLDLKELANYSMINAASVLINWNELEKVNISIEERLDVASMLWVTISFTREGQEYTVTGSTIQIAQKRFFELINKL